MTTALASDPAAMFELPEDRARDAQRVANRFNLKEIEAEAERAANTLDTIGHLQSIPAPKFYRDRDGRQRMDGPYGLAEWEWSHGLDTAERARLKKYTAPNGLEPDVFAEIAASVMGRGWDVTGNTMDSIEATMGEWLRLTRIADAYKSAKAGRELPRSFGGVRLDNLFEPERLFETEEGWPDGPGSELVTFYRHAEHWDELNKWRAGVSQLGLDVETTAIDSTGFNTIWKPGFRLRSVQLGTAEHAYVFDVETDKMARAVVLGLLTDETLTFITHTAYDVLVLAVHLGVDLRDRHIDSWALAKIADPRPWLMKSGKVTRASFGLKDLVARYLKDSTLPDAEKELEAFAKLTAPTGSRVGRALRDWQWGRLPVGHPTFTAYAGLDSVYCLRLADLLDIFIHAQHIPASLLNAERWLAAEAIGVTLRGLLLDLPSTRARLELVGEETKRLEAAICEKTGTAPRGPFLAAWLEASGVTFEPAERTATGRGKLDKTTLPAIAARYAGEPSLGPLLADLVALGKLTNRISNLRSFLACADPVGRVHPEIKTLQAHTGRMSIVRPALQTLKKHGEPGADAAAATELRSCFMADSGHTIVSADFDAVEVRVAAALSQDAALIRDLETGASPHDVTARRVYGEGFTPEQRQHSKTANFAILYGAGPKKIAETLSLSEAEGRKLVDAWRGAYPTLAAFGRKAEHLNPVITPSGRHIPPDPERTYANVNYLIQSTARDLLVKALRRFLSRPEYAATLLLPIHDEIVAQVPEDKADEGATWLAESMTFDFLGVKITAHTTIHGTHWGSAD